MNERRSKSVRNPFVGLRLRSCVPATTPRDSKPALTDDRPNVHAGRTSAALLRSHATCAPRGRVAECGCADSALVAGLDERRAPLLDTLVVWVSAADLGAWTCDLSPLLQHKLEAAFFPRGPGCEVDVRALAKQRLWALLHERERELPEFSTLRRIGYHLIDQPDVEAQRLGCVWLTLFPEVETIERVARVALDDTRSVAVRDQAAWTLCFRQRQTRHLSLYFSPEAEAVADASLLTLLERGGLGALPQLGAGLRHVCAPEILDRLAQNIAGAQDAIECFATPAFARAACQAALDLDSGAGTRALSLASATLGDEVLPQLRDALDRAPTLAHRIEAAHCLVSLEPSTLGAAEGAVRQGNPFPETSLRLLRYHADHPRQFPTLRGLQVARRTATLSAPEVAAPCRSAAEPLLAYASLAYAATHAHVEFLAYLVHAANDPSLTLRLFDQFADVFGAEHAGLPAPLAPLAQAGRFSDLERLARTTGEFAKASWELARHGRPYRALALLRSVPEHDVWSTAARVLGLFTAGRPDLAQRVLACALPAPMVGDGPFPGAEERYQMERPGADLPLRALAGQRPYELLQYIVPSAAGEPDRVDMSLLFSEAELLLPSLQGKSVVLLGDAARDQALIEQLQAAGAQVLSGPFPNADYFVDGPGAARDQVSRLRAAGVVRWTPT